MPNKILFCATVDYHFKAFHIPYLKWFKEQGWEVHIAASGNMNLPFVDKKYNLPIQRSPFSLKNVQGLKVLKKIIAENHYQMIHCHTPVGGVLGRMAARSARKVGTKVIYTAHGFHFCKGAPLKNWLIYYPIEKKLARITDCLITINQEDYNLAIKHRFKAGDIKQIHGVGVDTGIFHPIQDFHKNKLRVENGYQAEDILLFYAAEFNKNKNQQFLIKSLALLKGKAPNVKLLLAGDGPLFEECKQLANNLGVERMVDFLGLRDDIKTLLKMCDIAVASSLREGLPVNIMEAMSSSLPVIATDNRGHRELIRNGENGWIVSGDDALEMVMKMKDLIENRDLRHEMGRIGRELMLSKYAIERVLEEKSAMYASFMGQTEELTWAYQ